MRRQRETAWRHRGKGGGHGHGVGHFFEEHTPEDYECDMYDDYHAYQSENAHNVNEETYGDWQDYDLGEEMDEGTCSCGWLIKALTWTTKRRWSTPPMSSRQTRRRSLRRNERGTKASRDSRTRARARHHPRRDARLTSLQVSYGQLTLQECQQKLQNLKARTTC